jgi:transketolase
VVGMVTLIGEWVGPVYMRISRAAVPDVFDSSYKPQIGKGVYLREGSHVTLVGTGYMVSRCLQAAEQLNQQGISAGVVAMPFVKPLDIDLLVHVAKTSGAIVTAEDHTVVGGFGSAVAEALAGCYPAPVEMVGLQDNFAETGPDPETLMDACGLSVVDLVQAAHKVNARK